MSKSLTCTPANWEGCFNIAYLLPYWFLSPLSIVEDTCFVTPLQRNTQIETTFTKLFNEDLAGNS